MWALKNEETLDEECFTPWAIQCELGSKKELRGDVQLIISFLENSQLILGKEGVGRARNAQFLLKPDLEFLLCYCKVPLHLLSLCYNECGIGKKYLYFLKENIQLYMCSHWPLLQLTMCAECRFMYIMPKIDTCFWYGIQVLVLYLFTFPSSFCRCQVFLSLHNSEPIVRHQIDYLLTWWSKGTLN